MSLKLLWIGLTLMMVSSTFGFGKVASLIGAIFMVAGSVLLLLDK